MNTEQFQNQTQPTALISQAMTSSQNTFIVSSLANFSSLASGQQCRCSIQDNNNSPIELVLVTAVAAISGGYQLTCTRGIEGTAAIPHISGAAVAQVITQFHMLNMFPQAPREIEAAGTVALGVKDNILEINLGSAGTVNVNIDPTALIPGKKYTIVDVGETASSGNPINLVALSGGFSNYGNASTYPITIPGTALGVYSNGTNLRLV